MNKLDNLGKNAILIMILLVSFSNAESLFTSGEEGLFNDHKAKNVGDSLTVLVIESATTYQKNNRDMNNNTSMTIGAGTGFLSPIKETSLPAANAFKAAGTSETAGSINTKLTARVIDVLKNGDMKITGSKKVIINGENQIIKLSGIVRSEDIDPTNTVYSTSVANAEIDYENEGELKNSSDPGFLTKIFNIFF